MKKILAIVLVLAFVLSLGSMVLADTQPSWIVEGWNAFYSDGKDVVDWVRPIYYDAGNDNLYVLTKLEKDSSAGAVYVDNGADNVFTHLGYTAFNNKAAGNHSFEVDLKSVALSREHAITVIVNTSAD
jgi:hypothetical protein